MYMHIHRGAAQHSMYVHIVGSGDTSVEYNFICIIKYQQAGACVYGKCECKCKCQIRVANKFWPWAVCSHRGHSGAGAEDGKFYFIVPCFALCFVSHAVICSRLKIRWELQIWDPHLCCAQIADDAATYAYPFRDRLTLETFLSESVGIFYFYLQAAIFVCLISPM